MTVHCQSISLRSLASFPLPNLDMSTEYFFKIFYFFKVVKNLVAYKLGKKNNSACMCVTHGWKIGIGF